MLEFLPKPEVTRCYFDDTVAPHLSAMELRWHPDAPGSAERVWHLRYAFKDGMSVDEIHQLTAIDAWFSQ